MNNDKQEKFLKFVEENEIEVLKNESMALYTTFKIGGIADYFVKINTEEKFIKLIKFLCKNSIDYYIIGNGSNLIVSDENIHKVIIQTNSKPIDGIKLLDATTIYAFSGTFLTELCKFALKYSLTGLEFAYGIPAKLGGAIYMNASAYGKEMKSVLKYITYIDKLGNLQKIPVEKANFDYKSSLFMKQKLPIISAEINLTIGKNKQILGKMNELIKKRKEKQPLEFPNAGSVFKHPNNHFAGQLIEECGLKGMRIGQAAVSEKHAGFIINLGGATCTEILKLIKRIQNEVLKKKGIKLECELEYLC